MSYENFIVEICGVVMLIQFNCLQVFNVLSIMVFKELIVVFVVFEVDESQGCVVFIGVGDKVFVVGVDIVEMVEMWVIDVFVKVFFDGWQKDIVECVCKLWIVVVNGFVFGGGCEFVMMVDMIIVFEKVKFGQFEIKFVVVLGMGGIQCLMCVIGKVKVMDLCFIGCMMDVVEVEKVGFVVCVLLVEGFVDVVVVIVVEIVVMLCFVVMFNKEMVNVVFEIMLEQGLLFECCIWGIFVVIEDKVEGMKVFIEKCLVVWKGQQDVVLLLVFLCKGEVLVIFDEELRWIGLFVLLVFIIEKQK